MYNLFVDRQRAHSQQISHEKNVSMKKYVKKYCEKTRPELLNNYQKRINQFIRRVEHQPISMTLESDQNLSQKKSRTNTGGSKKFSMQTKKDVEQNEDVHNSFKYKNTADWISIYNQIQRKQRQNNLQFFVKKYGDPSMAFRSVGSQSKYNPCYDFRDRSQQKQINPPMRYTNKPTEQVLIKIKNKYKKNQADSLLKKENKTSQLLNKSDARLQKGSLNVSVKGDEQILRDSTPFLHSESHEGSNQGNDNHGKESYNQKRKKSTNKYYFKQMMDLQQNITDTRTKKFLRNMLYKCGVYRKKNKRSGNDTEVDQFSEFESVHNLK